MQMKNLSSLIVLLALLIGCSAGPAGRLITVGCFDSTAITIQDGVAAANPGDEVLVCPGTYPGGILVEKAGLKLRALEPIGAAKIVGTKESGTPFGIAVNADHVRIEGFEIYGFDSDPDASGILIGGTSSGTKAGWAIVEQNKIHDNSNGISFWHTNDNRINRNKMFSNRDTHKTRVQTEYHGKEFDFPDGDGDRNKALARGENRQHIADRFYLNDGETPWRTSAPSPLTRCGGEGRGEGAKVAQGEIQQRFAECLREQ
jgi:parallel beta-helix repeat protein